MKQLWSREKQKHLLAFLGLLWNKVAVTLRCPLWDTFSIENNFYNRILK